MYVNLSCFWTVHLEAPGIGKYGQLVHEVCSQNTGAKLGSYNYLSLFYTSAFQKQNHKQLVTFFFSKTVDISQNQNFTHF